MDIGTNFRFCIVLDMLKKDAGSKCATSWVHVALDVSRGERAVILPEECLVIKPGRQ